MAYIPKHKNLILFDGVCNLCNNSVQFVIKRDKKNKFLFTALQGETATAVLKEFRIDNSKIDSIILYEPARGVSLKSTAALKIASKMGFPINLLAVFLIVPAFIRNWVYDYIAKNRYQWYGKQDNCMIPTPELKEKFLP
ncbi:thiol-disulfide oxidoreductase DCC family protein [Paucihalobacter sp.]|uniref:thiol-disulfide oxidoreductase DCC family protein n=1 Tax=Paucihalobacter sp. TaxID=2850405 RepID=UPI002FE1D0F6